MAINSKKRIASALLTIIIVLSLSTSLVPQSVSAAPAAKTEITGGAISADVYSSDNYISDIDTWTVSEDSVSSLTTVKDETQMRITSKTSALSCEYIAADGIDCSTYREVGVYLRSIPNADCTVTLTVLHDLGSSAHTAVISSGKEFYIFVRLPDGAAVISEIRLTAEIHDTDSSGDSLSPSVIFRGAVLSASDHTKNIRDFSVFGITGLDDTSSATEEAPVIAGPIVSDNYGKESALRVFLKGTSGVLTMNLAENGDSFSVVGSSAISENRTCYIFKISELTEESFYRLDLTGIGDSSVIIEHVDLIDLKISATNTAQCTVSKYIYNSADENISISGTVSRDTVIEHINGNLELYEVNLWEDDIDSVLSADPIDIIDMSTTFSFTTHVNKDHFAFCSYIIAVNDGGNIYPITDPIYPSSGITQPIMASVSSVAGVSLEDAFISGFDNFVIDIDAEKFLSGESFETSSVFTHDGASFYIDKEIISDITKQVKFLSSAGVGIIFSLTSAEGFDPETEADYRTLAAIVSFLSERYSPYGFILSNPVKDSSENDISHRAHSTAVLARLSYAAAKNNCLIFTDVNAENEGETFAWLLGYYSKLIQTPNLEMLINAPSGRITDFVDAAEDAAIDGGYTSRFSAITEADSVSAKDIAEKLSSASVSYIIRVKDSGNFSIPTADWSEHSVSSYPDDGNSVFLWDFTKSYDTGGFTVASGSSGIITETNSLLENFTKIPSCRCLKTALHDGSRVMITQPASPMQLTDAPRIRFVMACTSDTPFSLDFIFVSGKDRAIFTAEYNGSGVYAPVCDLSETNIHGKIDRIAIMLRSGDSAEIGIASVTASGTKDPDSIADTIYITEAAKTSDLPDLASDNVLSESTVKYAAIGAVIIMTIVVFAVLSVRKS